MQPRCTTKCVLLNDFISVTGKERIMKKLLRVNKTDNLMVEITFEASKGSLFNQDAHLFHGDFPCDAIN